METRTWRPRTTGQYLAVFILVLCLMLSSASLLFGALSWARVKKWRQFHNYVFLQMIAASAMFITIYFNVRIIYKQDDNIYYNAAAEVILETYFNIMLHWQLVTTLMFYVEIVKAITVNVNLARGYLFANLFAWVLPVFEVILDLWFQKVELHFMEFIALMVGIVYTVVYLRVVYILITSAWATAGFVMEVLHQILVSTFAFLTGGITLLVPLLTVLRRADLTFYNLTEEDMVVTYMLNLMAVIVFFLSMKNHRESWAEYRCSPRSFTDNVFIE